MYPLGEIWTQIFSDYKVSCRIIFILHLQAEKASDKDIHVSIATKLKSHFNRKPLPSMSSAGIRLVAATALDKQSRYFEGRKKPQLTLPTEKKPETASPFDDDDEIFWR